jgi:hypothetical protein
VRNRITRRAVIKRGLLAGTIVPVVGLIGNPAAAAPDLSPLDPKDPTAVTLGFYNDSTKVDAVANPLYAADQKCRQLRAISGETG